MFLWKVLVLATALMAALSESEATSNMQEVELDQKSAKQVLVRHKRGFLGICWLWECEEEREENSERTRESNERHNESRRKSEAIRNLKKVELDQKSAKRVLVRHKRGFLWICWFWECEKERETNERSRESAERRNENRRKMECPTKCWNPWPTTWGACSHQCGGAGLRWQNRTIKSASELGECKDYANSNKCTGPSLRSQACNRFCSNGGTPNSNGCSCPVGWGGTCCQTSTGFGNFVESGCRMDIWPNQRSTGGDRSLTSAQNEYACRDQCLGDITCVAADWNRQTNACYRHQVIAPLRTTASCCVHFVKSCSVSYRNKWYSGSCGRSSYQDAASLYYNRGASRIVGGDDARPHEFPWTCSLRRYPSPTYQRHLCGAVLIHPRFVLTAAHCMIYSNPGVYAIVLGEHKPRAASNIRLVHTVQSFSIHPSYNTATSDSDIAILKLSQKVTLNQFIAPVCAPEPGTSYHNDTSQAAGWGHMVFGGSTVADTLQWVPLPILSNNECTNAMRNLRTHAATSVITWNMICAGRANETQRDTCQGDSGGPLTTRRNGKFEVVGLTSWGRGCASGTPGVYTRVSNFVSWVTDQIRTL